MWQSKSPRHEFWLKVASTTGACTVIVILLCLNMGLQEKLLKFHFVMNAYNFQSINVFLTMGWWNMILQCGHCSAAIATNFTIEWLHSLMDPSNMFLQVTFLSKAIVTRPTFEWLLFLMDWSNMLLQVTFQSTSIVTRTT